MGAVINDTLLLDRRIDAPMAAVWDAYVDPAKRVQWSVPAGELMIYDEADFREQGRDRYRCGPPENLSFQVAVEYIKIVPDALIVYAETVRTEGQPLATSLLTWEFKPEQGATLVKVTNQLVSFVGQGMIDGNRSGHIKALKQLSDFLTEG